LNESKTLLQKILPYQNSFILTFPFLERYDFITCGMILKTKSDLPKTLLRLIGQKDPKLAIPEQRHTKKILPILNEDDLNLLEKESFDGVFTKLKNIFLCVQVADCIPLFVIAFEKRMVGLLHVGWRGFVSGIVKEFLTKAERLFKIYPEDLIIVLGPYIKGCCYEVSCGVAALFDRDMLNFNQNKIRLDLGKALFKELKKAGVKKQRIFLSPDCTFCHPEHYFSFRREKDRSKKMLAFIGISEGS